MCPALSTLFIGYPHESDEVLRVYIYFNNVKSITPNYDQQVREVEVEVGGEIFRKSVNKLIPLELNFSFENDRDVSEDETKNVESVRPKRKAATRCDNYIRELIDEGHLV